MEFSYRSLGFALGSCAIGSAVAVFSATEHADAQSYPTGNVTIIAPFAPGGGSDVAARLLAEALSAKLNGQFIVENRPGASGNVGHAEASRAEPDGKTLLLAFSSTLACNAALFPSLNWSVEDFAPIGIFTRQPLIAAVTASLDVDSIEEFVEYAKSHPGDISYGSSGVGSQAHIANILFQQATGTEMVHVPYKGTGDLLPDLLSGQVQIAFGLPTGLQSHITAGKLKGLAVTGSERDSSVPDAPTMRERGIDMFMEGWYGLMAPAGTSPEIVGLLSAALKELTEDQAFVEKANKAGYGIHFTGPEDATVRIASESQECADVVKSAGIQLN